MDRAPVLDPTLGYAVGHADGKGSRPLRGSSCEYTEGHKAGQIEAIEQMDRIDALAIVGKEVADTADRIVDLLLRAKHGQAVPGLCDAEEAYRIAVAKAQALVE